MRVIPKRTKTSVGKQQVECLPQAEKRGETLLVFCAIDLHACTNHFELSRRHSDSKSGSISTMVYQEKDWA